MNSLLLCALIPLVWGLPWNSQQSHRLDGLLGQPKTQSDPNEELFKRWLEAEKRDKIKEAFGTKFELEGTLTLEDGDKQSAASDDGDVKEMFKEFIQWKIQQKIQAAREEAEKKAEMAEKFEAWKRFQMEEQIRQFREQQEAEERQKQMEQLQEKQNLVQKLANLSMDFQEQKMKLIHGVTSQFLEFCKCSDTSAAVKNFFQQSFGESSYDDEWSTSVNDLNDGEDVWSSGQNNGSMNFTGNNGSMNFTGNNGTMNFTGTLDRNGTMGNFSNGDNDDAETRTKWLLAAQKFYHMTQEEKAKELFKGLVNTLCQSASQYVTEVKQFEQFFVQYVSIVQSEDDSQ